MPTVSMLRLLIDIFYYSLIIISSIIISWFLYMWIFEANTKLMYDNVDLRNITSLGYLMLALSATTLGLFFSTLYHLRKAILKISNNEIYHQDASKHLKRSGLAIILYALVKSMGEYVNSYMEEEAMTILSLDFKGFSSFWFILILGLFFQLIGRVLENARKLKLENDLTI